MSEQRPFTGRSVLIVDDSEVVQQQLAAIYSGLGFEIAGILADGLAAWHFLEKKKPDIVSLDIVMPVMDGIECYRKIKVAHPDQQCLMVSVLSKDAKVIESLAKEIEPWRFVAKPVGTAQVIEAVSIALGLKPATTAEIAVPPANEQQDPLGEDLDELVVNELKAAF